MKSKKKFTKTIQVLEVANDGLDKKPISIEQYVKALESSITLPLNENINFHQIVVLAGEKKYKQALIDSCIFFFIPIKKLDRFSLLKSYAHHFETFIFEKNKL